MDKAYLPPGGGLYAMRETNKAIASHDIISVIMGRPSFETKDSVTRPASKNPQYSHTAGSLRL